MQKKKSKNFRHKVKTVPVVVKGIFCVSIAYTIGSSMLRNNWEEVFSGGMQIDAIVNNIALALIASTIFYYIVVHLKEYGDKKILNKYIDAQINHIIRVARNINTELLSAEDKISKEQMEKILKEVNPKAESPVIIGVSNHKANWIQYLVLKRKMIKTAIGNLLKRIQFVEPELVVVLDKLDSGLFLLTIDAITSVGINNENLSFMTSQFIEFFNHIDEISKLQNKLIKPYL